MKEKKTEKRLERANKVITLLKGEEIDNVEIRKTLSKAYNLIQKEIKSP